MTQSLVRGGGYSLQSTGPSSVHDARIASPPAGLRSSANLPVFLPLSGRSFNLTLGGALPMKVSELHDQWAGNIKDPNRPTPQDADLWLEYVSAFSSVADYLIVDD